MFRYQEELATVRAMALSLEKWKGVQALFIKNPLRIL